MSGQIDYARESLLEDRGLKPSADPSVVSVGVLLSIDAAANRVAVSINGSEAITMPFTDGLYRVGRTVKVLRSPFEGGRSVHCLGPTKSASMRPTGTITAVDAGNNQATVTVDGASWVLPYIPLATFAVDDEVYVLREPSGGGTPTLILGPCTVPPVIEEDEETAPAVPVSRPTTETVTKTILPTSTGTWNAYRSAWDRWNTTRYGGVSTLYQGDPAFSSHGPFTGLATYGNQVSSLGATTISKLEVRLRGADLALGSYPAITLQGSPHGTRPAGAPSSTGVTAAGSPGRAGAIWLELPADIRAGFLSGTLKGLCTVGSGYNAVRGISAGDGMALRVTYTRPV